MSQHIQRHRMLKRLQQIAGFVILMTIAFLFLFNQQLASASQRSKILAHFTPAWNSFKKLSNLLYVQQWNSHSSLPVYELSIEPFEMEQLLREAPYERATAPSPLPDSQTKAVFRSPADNFEAETTISLLTEKPEQWRAEKKAFLLEFPNNSLFKGLAHVNLEAPDSSTYFAQSLHAYRAQKLGLIHASPTYIRLKINKRDYGVYAITEAWSPEFLAHNDLYESDSVYSYIADGDPFAEDNANKWIKHTNKSDASIELRTLIDVVTKTSDADFEKYIPALLDLESFYKWQLVRTLAGTQNPNTILIYKKTTGKFEPIVGALGLEPVSDFAIHYNADSLLARRILSNKTFFDEYKKIAADYAQNSQHLADDIAQFSAIKNNLMGEFFNDQAKRDTDIQFSRIIAEQERLIRDNVSALAIDIDSQTNELAFTPTAPATSIIFKDSFAHYDKRFDSIDEFLKQHATFTGMGSSTVALKEGFHILTKTTVIPQHIQLVLYPGARLQLGPNVSLISYGNVSAIGTPDKPIIIEQLFPDSELAWGSFVLLSSDGSHKLTHVHVSGGSGDVINNIPIAAQVTIRGGRSEISNCVFERSFGDDSLHATAGSITISRTTFRNNKYDGVDLEFVQDSLIEHSLFSNNAATHNEGDAIDLAGSTNVSILHTKIAGFTDNGISIGERTADTHIEHVVVVESGTAVLAKEGSNAVIMNSVFVRNTNGLTLRRQKNEYEHGGSALVDNTTIWGNKHQITTDIHSNLTIKNSSVEGGIRGENINTNEPDLFGLIPEDMHAMINTSL